MLEVAVLYPEFFWAYPDMYRDKGFNKSIGECTVKQTNQQKSWLYLAVFRYQITKQEIQRLILIQQNENTSGYGTGVLHAQKNRIGR